MYWLPFVTLLLCLLLSGSFCVSFLAAIAETAKCSSFRGHSGVLRKFAQHFPDTYFSVCTLRKGFLYIAKATDVQVCVCPVPFHRDDLQVAPKVARVKAAEREPVAVPRQHRRRVQLTPVCQLRVEDRDLRCAIHVRPDAGQPTSRDPASFVRHLDGDILASLCNDDSDWRGIGIVLKAVLHRSQRVLHQLEQHLMQVAGDVRHREVVVAVHLDLWCTSVQAQAHLSRVVNRMLRDNARPHLDVD
mmetsp:Transcript_14478/g.24532  ORF Transcript_14478/g.24532 Transcript_14478/m.24532 type:complete len:245 (+) Transcript_14478:316-1050(+)